MNKVFSTRLDESAIHRIGVLAKTLGTTQKAVIEMAIHTLAEKVEATQASDVWELTCGAWHRDEPPETTVQQAREAFRNSMQRYHQ